MPGPYATAVALNAALQRALLCFRTDNNVSRQTGLQSAWNGANPTTATACSSTTSGAEFPFTGVSLLGVDHGTGPTAAGMSLLMADRLCHQGGLSGTSTGVQTTNLPTATLTRSTSGVGVMAGLEIYTNVGSTITTATISYTNQAGTSGRTGLAPIGGSAGSGYGAASRMTLMALQSGDTGVRSVESVQLAASTGVAGNFGVTLFRPLVVVPYRQRPDTTTGRHVRFLLTPHQFASLPSIDSGACVFSLVIAFGTGGFSGSTTFYLG